LFFAFSFNIKEKLFACTGSLLVAANVPIMATTSFYTLFESASGYGLFSILETEEIGAFLEEVKI
jgi:hypothetical protein